MNNAEKRSVTTDALQTLGTIIDNVEGTGRDAIHLAVEPVIAGETLFPGQHIGLSNGKAYSTCKKKLGIVDPFVIGSVPKGSKFWLVVFPRQITSLRHVWSHPDFPEESSPADTSTTTKNVLLVEEPIVIPKAVLETASNPIPVVADAASKKVYDQISEKYLSEEWIRNFASKIPLKYEVLMDAAQDWLDSGEYLNYGSLLDGEYVPDEFWDHFEVVTGNKAEGRGNFFTCSC